jgi:pimeloyl-ACP methyl ester carboxylesterase
MMRIGPHDLEVLEAGPADAPVLLLLHGTNPVSPKALFVAQLARRWRVVAPSAPGFGAPGFGASPRPDDFDTIYDLTHLYLDVLDALPGKVAVVGLGFGGWIAAEVAVAGHPRLDRLVLVDAFGIKLGARDERDFLHIFNTDPAELHRCAWHDPANRPAGIWGLGWQSVIDETMSDAEMVTLARNWNSLCLSAWRPHMFNPQLKHWLHRIKVPTLMLWGESDRVVPVEYGRRYAALIPGAGFETIPQAGHHPELERPDAFVAALERFLA